MHVAAQCVRCGLAFGLFRSSSAEAHDRAEIEAEFARMTCPQCGAVNAGAFITVEFSRGRQPEEPSIGGSRAARSA